MCVFYISVWEKSTETTIGGTLHTFRVFTSLPISDVNSLLNFSTFFFYFILSLQSVSSLIPIIRHTKQEENTRNWVSVEKLIEQPLLCFACFVCGSPDARMNKLNREMNSLSRDRALGLWHVRAAITCLGKVFRIYLVRIKVKCFPNLVETWSW